MASKKKPAPDVSEHVSAARRSVRTFTHWTYSRLRAAEQRAETGNLYDAAAICEWLLGDDAIGGALDARVDALLGVEPTFEASGDKRRSNRAVKALEVGEDFWRAYPESELRQLIAWRLLLGVAPGRHDWTDALPEHGGRILPTLEFWHPSGLRYDFQTARWLGRDALGVEFPIVAGDGTWLLHALARFRPWSLGLWRQLARWVLFRHLAIGDYSRHSEKGAMIVGTSSNTNTDPQRKKLADDLASSGADAAIVLQSGFDLKFLEVTANTKQIYEAQVELANRAIAIRIRGGNLTTNVEGGSKAAAAVQYQAGELPKLKADAEALTTTLHDQSLVWWAEFNFGDRRLAPWPVYPVDPPEDAKAKAETANTAADAATKFDRLGFEIDEKTFREEFKLEWLKGRKEVPPPPNPPPTDGKPPNEGDPDPDPAELSGKRPKAPTDEAKSFRTLLASGELVAENRGFVDGQLYADAVADSALARAREILAADERAILRVLDEATSYDDLRERLRALYRDQEPDALNTLVARAMRLAHLGGQHAVNEDA